METDNLSPYQLGFIEMGLKLAYQRAMKRYMEKEAKGDHISATIDKRDARIIEDLYREIVGFHDIDLSDIEAELSREDVMRYLRHELQCTVEDIADLFGVSVESVQRMIDGEQPAHFKDTLWSDEWVLNNYHRDDRELADDLGVHYSAVRRAKRRLRVKLGLKP